MPVSAGYIRFWVYIMFAEIVIDIAHPIIDRIFSFEIPADLNVCEGQHVLVPFGRGNNPREGFVLSLSNNVDSGVETKPVLRVLEPYPVLTKEQIELARWMKKGYNCLLIDAIRIMLPGGLRGSKIHEKRESIISPAPGIDIELEKSKLLKKDGTPRSSVQYEVLSLFSCSVHEIAKSDCTSFIPGSSSAINALIKKGILVENSITKYRSPYHQRSDLTSIPVLNENQSSAVEAVSKSIDSGDSSTYVLHGVTGSGKTEVYLNSIAHCLSLGKSAIVLVPEISLTPQTVGRFRSRFGQKIAVLHSGLSTGERFDEWRRVRLGLAPVVVGARSAIFAPLENIGIIIIDEEHESTYQSESAPRYTAHDIAAKRCLVNKCPLILGSATPSLMTYFRAVNGRYRLLNLPSRVMDRQLPEVETVDMRTEFLSGNNSIFSAKLLSTLKACLEAGKQAMLLLNRRGYSTFVMCKSCGNVINCPDCDIPMTYHKTDSLMKCHFCGSTQRIPDRCPNCGKPYIKYFGIGTEQVEENLKHYFPDVSVLRMDADTMTAKDSYEKALTAFSEQRYQILVGTQMIAKGHDFPNVTLVGVVVADSGLNIPDYRSTERTFQLLTQVAGRAGRADSPGRVVIQTYNPVHPAIRFSKAQDYCGFYEYEITERRKALFPPYTLFIRILFSSQEEEGLSTLVEQFRSELETVFRAQLEERYDRTVLTMIASPAPIKKKMNTYRYQVLIKLLRTKETGKLISLVYETGSASPEARPASIEINPLDML